MNDAKQWRKDTGLDFISIDKKDAIEEVIKFSGRELKNINLEEFDEHLIVISNYYTYLLSEFGTLTARVQYMEEWINIGIGPIAAKYSASSAGERRAMALYKNIPLREKNEKLTNEKVKLEMLRPVCDAIRNKIYVMSKIYDRRIRSEYRSTRS